MNEKKIGFVLAFMFLASLLLINSPELFSADSPETNEAPKKDTADSDEVDHLQQLIFLAFHTQYYEESTDALNRIVKTGDTRFVAGLIDLLRYNRQLTLPISRGLIKLTGKNMFPDWGDWVEWAGRHPEIKSFDDYPVWKARLYEQFDEGFKRFLYADVKIAPGSRVEEIVWGGVRVDGIPALDNPKMIDGKTADYLEPGERVFGVSINGDTRAYPARFLDWHEMFNDVVGGTPVAMAY
ncbi:MAG: DUF3179 domain-containing protein [Deltaproteobacteria bacterium]|nr:DUF3179 domain-containing protein [Deltaproteobacteria bacterium]